jgi:primosomal protein N''
MYSYRSQILNFRLTADLVDAERYQDAYYKLSDEVNSLADRNALAEDEAQRLSQFNAEILSHNNPAQRIMYLDRVRRELAEVKQVRFHNRMGLFALLTCHLRICL